MARPQFTPREKSFLNDWNTCMKGPVQNGAQHPSEFRMVMAGNNVAIQVESKLRDAKNYGRFEVKTSYMSAVGVLMAIDRLLKDPNKSKLSYSMKDFIFFGPGKKSDNPMEKGKITIGRDNEGCVYMGLSGKDITPIKFVFALSMFDELCDDQGNRVGGAEESEFAAAVFVESYRGLLPVIATMYYKEPEKKEGGGQGGNGGNGGGGYGGGNNGGNRGGNGGGYGGGNNGGGNSGGGFDSDIPF
ncbi:hypothetical protein pEaSNUABM37_00276 [Erwinia phage pEa_SNUABM_37]|nr:hypothetical protein pEaSNUABM37_00276 [Erwinia phage pEa_SNUABM_37]QXO10744.1 hypothetical protein pEaSNUABM48_00276 [Erwinia phage pEa_SNUABM_48]